VLPSQIEEFGLETRPTKKTDGRAKGFKGESVELDALPPETLQKLVDACIRKHIDKESWRQTELRQRTESAELSQIADDYREQGGDDV